MSEIGKMINFDYQPGADEGVKRKTAQEPEPIITKKRLSFRNVLILGVAIVFAGCVIYNFLPSLKGMW